MTGVRLAIVGSTDFPDEDCWEEAVRLVGVAIDNLHPEVVISGGARGIDTVAQDVAATRGYLEPKGSFVVHRPRVKRWGGPDGFQARNLVIAQDCTHLLAIRSRASTTYGSGWTADRAREMGKDVRVYLLPAQPAEAAPAAPAPQERPAQLVRADGPCASCQDRIFWVLSAGTDKPMPLNPDPVPDGNVALNEDGKAVVLTRDEMAGYPMPRYVTHFTTCPRAATHRRKP